MMVDEEDLCKACFKGSNLYFDSDGEWKVNSLEEERHSSMQDEEKMGKEVKRGEK